MKRKYLKPEFEIFNVEIPTILATSEITDNTSVRFDGEKVDVFSGEITEGDAGEAASRRSNGYFWDDEL